MDRRKWIDVNDLVYFKLQESSLQSTWRVGKVEEVKVDRDNNVQEVTYAVQDD